MTSRIIHSVLLFLAWSFSQTAWAQEIPNRNWDGEKIRGVRFIPYPVYIGFAFLNFTYVPGQIEFTNGEIADSLNLRYSSFKDELVYYNKAITSQIVIDKASLKGFSYTEKDGSYHLFRKQYYDGLLKGERYFEVLSEGEPDLLVYRKVTLSITSAYKDDREILKNMIYETSYQYFLYSREQGYTSVRINQGGLLAKFDKTLKKPIKKLLRKNRIKIIDEASFILAWKVAEKEGYKIIF